MKKIDFLDELAALGFRPKVPREVIEELKDLKKERKTSQKERQMIDLAFQLIERSKVGKMKLGGRNVDDGLISKGQAGIYIATLDRGIKVKIPNRVVIDSARKSLRVERG